MGRVLSFFQSVLDQHLALSSIKGQISALVIFFLFFFQRRKTFVQVVAYVVSPRFSVLQKPPFEPIREIPLSTLLSLTRLSSSLPSFLQGMFLSWQL